VLGKVGGTCGGRGGNAGNGPRVAVAHDLAVRDC
jgi:hypothetical protein